MRKAVLLESGPADPDLGDYPSQSMARTRDCGVERVSRWLCARVEWRCKWRREYNSQLFALFTERERHAEYIMY